MTFIGSKGIDPRTFRPLAPAARPAIRSGGPRFAEAAAGYLTEVQRDPAAKLSEHTAGQNEFVYKLFAGHAGDVPLAAIDKRQAADFLDHIARERGLSTGRSIATRRRCLRLDWAARRCRFEGRNPWKGQWRAIGKGTGWRAFEIDELNRLYQPRGKLTPRGVPNSRKRDLMQDAVDSRRGQHAGKRDYPQRSGCFAGTGGCGAHG